MPETNAHNVAGGPVPRAGAYNVAGGPVPRAGAKVCAAHMPQVLVFVFIP